jgi:gas vesicle protein
MGQIIRFLVGALIGAFIGSAVAILLAPSSGKTTRVRITENTLRIRNEIQQAAIEKRSELERELADLRHNIVIN